MIDHDIKGFTDEIIARTEVLRDVFIVWIFDRDIHVLKMCLNPLWAREAILLYRDEDENYRSWQDLSHVLCRMPEGSVHFVHHLHSPSKCGPKYNPSSACARSSSIVARLGFSEYWNLWMCFYFSFIYVWTIVLWIDHTSLQSAGWVLYLRQACQISIISPPSSFSFVKLTNARKSNYERRLKKRERKNWS